MRFLRHFISTLVFFAPVLHAQNTSLIEKSLEDSFRAALQRSELVSESKNAVDAAESSNDQALSMLLPAITTSASYQRQQDMANPFFSSIFPNEQSFWKLSATQPIFHGFRDIAALRQSRDMVELQKQNHQLQIQGLYLAVAQSFYQLQSLGEEMEQLQKELEINRERLQELVANNRFGKNRHSEVFSVEASVYSLEAQLKSLEIQFSTQLEQFFYLTDFPRNVSLKKESEKNLKELKDLPVYLEKIPKRADVLSAQSEFKSAEENVSIAWGQHLPAIDLTGNYYLIRTGTPLRDVQWDVQLVASMPLFQWGGIQAQVQKAVAEKHGKEMKVARLTRLASQEIKTIFQSVASGHVQVEKLRKAREASKKHIAAVRRDHKNGLSSTSDLLTAEANAQQILRSLTKTEYGLKMDWMRLEVATNQKP